MKSIAIFTAGFHARATFRHLARQPDCRVVAFVENSPALQGSTLFGVRVLHPESLAAIDFDLVAVPGRNQDAIMAQLADRLGVPPGKIWRVNKSEVRPAPEELERRGSSLAALLRRTLAVLDDAGGDYWTMHSGLLGLMREQELALFSDLDLCVVAEGFEALDTRFRAEGFQVKSVRSPADGTLVQISLFEPAAQAGDEPAAIDLHPISVGAVEAVWPVNLKPLSLPSAYFHGHAFRSYRGVALRVPAEAGAVLVELYGADWSEPAETWNGRYAFTSPVPADLAVR